MVRGSGEILDAKNMREISTRFFMYYRAWIIFEDEKPLYFTLRKNRPEAWAAWEAQRRPDHGFLYQVKARRVKICLSQ